MECLQAFCPQGGWYNNSVFEYSHSVNRVKVRAMYEERTYLSGTSSCFDGNPSSIVDSKSCMASSVVVCSLRRWAAWTHGENKVALVHLVRGGIRLN